MNKVIHGDCIKVLKILPDNSVDSIVTDPPYELGFMNKKWDNTGIAYNLGKQHHTGNNSFKKEGERDMRTKFIKTSFEIPVPIDKPDLNNVL